MVKGAAASKAVDAYLRFISTDKPRGRRVDTGLLELKIQDEDNLAKKVILIAQLREAERVAESQKNEQALEDAFVEHVRWFSGKHDIPYAVWREMGVGPGVLNRAGITP
jgi:hypothetical protein